MLPKVSNGAGIEDMPVRAGCNIQCKRHEQLRGNRGWVHSMSSGANQEKMKNRDKSRKWMWWLLGSIAALQMYFVRELLAAFALFAMGFLALASIVVSLYTLHRVWAVTVDRVADSRHPVMVAVRHGIYSVEEMARRPFRRPGPAQPAS